MNKEDHYRVRTLLQALIQLPSYLADDESHDVDLDFVIDIAKRNVKQIDEYVAYLDKEMNNEN